MSLNEKAKTSGCYHCSCCRFYHGLVKGCELPVCAYILRKDAQQEIDKQEQEWEVVMGDAEKDCYKCYSQMERERGELKQKLKQTCDEIRSKLKFLDYEQYHGDLKQSLNPTVREINQLLEELLQK